MALDGVGAGVDTICPGVGGGGGTSGGGANVAVDAGVVVAGSGNGAGSVSKLLSGTAEPAAAGTETGVGGGKMLGVEIDGVGRDVFGTGSFIAGVGRRKTDPPDGVAECTADCLIGDCRDTAALVSGVIAATEMRTIAPQTLHRALTPFGGTFAGSTRNTDRQS